MAGIGGCDRGDGDLILRSLRSKRLEGWTQQLDSRPSFETRAPDSASALPGGRAPQDEGLSLAQFSSMPRPTASWLKFFRRRHPLQPHGEERILRVSNHEAAIGARRHPSRRAQERAPQDEVGNIFTGSQDEARDVFTNTPDEDSQCC
jgi:hypothetical protein